MVYHEDYNKICIQSVASNKFIHVSEDNIYPGTKVHLWDYCGGCENESWTFHTLEKIDDTKYVVNITNRHMFFNLQWGVAKDGTHFHMWGSTSNPTDSTDISSKWLIEYIQPDVIMIKTMISDLYVNIQDSTKHQNGGVVHLWGNRVFSLNWKNNQYRLVGLQSSKILHVDKEQEHMEQDDEIVEEEHIEEQNSREIIETKRKETIDETSIDEEWDLCERKFVSHEETSLNIEVEVGKIAQMVCRSVQAYFGDIFSMVQIAENISLSFMSGETSHHTDDKIILHEGTNYLLIKLQTKSGSKKIKTGVFKKGKTSRIYIAEICCLRPKNKAAEDKCKKLMNQKINEVLHNVTETF
jgi:hypothetical protein